MNYLKIISLESCPFSIADEKLLNEKDIKIELIKVNSSSKEKHKNKHIKTFPQIYFITSKNKNILLGGYTDLNEINQNVYKTNLDESIKYLSKKYPKMSRKNKLRLIQLFN